MGGDPVTPLCSCRGIRKRPVPKPCRFNAALNQSHAGQKTPGQKPLRTKATSSQKPARSKTTPDKKPHRCSALPLGSEPSATPKDARQERLCEVPSARRTIKGRPAKDTRKTRRQSPPPQKTPDKCARKYRPAKTGPKDPLRTQHPERPPCKPSCGPKIAGKFGVPQQNRYLRTYRTTPAAGQYSRPSDRLPGKSTA